MPFLTQIGQTFFLSGFSFLTLKIHRTAGLFHSTTSTSLRTLRYFFATLHVRWLSRVFNRNACVYQTATQWDLPPYQITIWLIDDAMFVCLLDELILRFCYNNFDIRNWWNWPHIDYHPCITSEPTNLVC